MLSGITTEFHGVVSIEVTFWESNNLFEHNLSMGSKRWDYILSCGYGLGVRMGMCMGMCMNVRVSVGMSVSVSFDISA